MKIERIHNTPPINDKKFSFMDTYLTTNSYTFHHYFTVMKNFIQIAKLHKSYICDDSGGLRHKLYIENLNNARKMANLYLKRVECPHGISDVGLLKVVEH